MPKKPSLSRSMSCIDRLIHSTLDPRAIMQRVITEAARAVGSETAALSLRQGDHWTVRYVHGFPKDVIGAQMDDRQEPHVMLAIQTRKPVVINDAFTDERVNREHMKEWGVRSVLAVPLVTGNEVIGVLLFNQHKAGVPFTESHVKFADQLASSLSLALRNTGLLERLRAELAERKKAEQALQKANELLQVQTEELRAANEELQAQQEELQAQAEELRASEESLRESEQRYRSLFENMLDGYAYCQMLFDGQGRPTDFLYLEVNDAFARLTGLKDVVGKRATQVIPTIRESHPELLETYGRVATTGRPERLEIEFKPLGIWLSISVYSPRKSYFTAVFDNITARKHAEHERRERMKELACLYAVSRDVQEDLSMDELCRRVVKHLIPAMQFPEITVPVVELNGKRFTSENFTDGLSHGLQAEITAEGEVLGHLRVYYAQERPFLIPEAQNLVNGVAGALGAWLERTRAEGALRQLSERNEEALRVARMGHWEFDLATGTFTFNDQYYTLHGTTVQEAGGYQMTAEEFARRYVHPDDAHLVQEHIQQAAAATDPNFQLQAEARILCADGEVRWVTVWFRIEKDAQGKTTTLHGVNQDITERKYAQETLQKVNEQLQMQAEELQTQAEELRASEEVLRDLNTTLESRVAQRTAQLQHRARQLQKLTLEASQTEDRERKRMAEILHDDLQQIIAGAKFHLSLLRNRVKYDASLQALALQIDGMLKEAIGKSRGLSHELSPAILHDGFTEILGWLANQVQAKHGLVVHVHADSQARLQSDAIKAFLYKTAQELLFNVVKHARVNEARIRFRRCGQCVCLSVSDRGCGFDPQGLRDAAGFGLLSIRERIELLGGRMKIKSAEGKGSTFFIAVPDAEQVVAPPPSGGTAGPRAQNRLRVLLADDHRIVRESLRLLLSEEPDVDIVGEAAHGREAVDLALRLEPDVVIMDVSMPLIDGDVATCQIKEHLPNTRVIALSTYSEPETMEKMYGAGAESYVLKTASSEELLAAIRGENQVRRGTPV